jgi:hypothetical protein
VFDTGKIIYILAIIKGERDSVVFDENALRLSNK